jgi:RND family efflux transporter MFP subunit
VIDSSDLSSLRIRRETEPRRLPPRRFLLVAIGLVALIVVAAAAAYIARGRVTEVRVASAALRGGDSGGGLTANGYVVARTKASVSSKVPGRLASLNYEEGDAVPAGAVIARLEAAEYQAAAHQARAELLALEAVRHEVEAALAQATRGRDRARALAEAAPGDGLVSRQAVEDAETALAVAEARLQAATARIESARQGLAMAEANLENTLVRAPFAGTVLRKDAEVGEVVAPSVGGGLTRGAVVTMADLSTLEVEVDVNESYIAGIRSEQPAEIVLDAYPGERFPGRVRQVVPTADRQKATVLVRVAIDSQDPRILPEMGARVVFRAVAGEGESGAAAAGPRVFVPAAAVRSEAGETVVYVVADGRVRRQVIEAGPVSGGEREVRAGLRGGETLVLEPPPGLVDGAPVRVTGRNAQRGRE